MVRGLWNTVSLTSRRSLSDTWDCPTLLFLFQWGDGRQDSVHQVRHKTGVPASALRDLQEFLESVRVAHAFAKMVVIPAIGLSLATLQKLSRWCWLPFCSAPELVGEIKLGLITSRHSTFSQSGLRVHPSCHQPDVAHEWLQVAAIGTTVSETDIFACSTSNLSATGGRFVGERASECGHGEDCVSALCGALQS